MYVTGTEMYVTGTIVLYGSGEEVTKGNDYAGPDVMLL